MAPPFRADQIGSLLRPKELLDARSSLSSPSQMYSVAKDQRIKEAEQKAIDWAVQEQLKRQIRPICSGEYSRHIFYGGFFETHVLTLLPVGMSLDGMRPEPNLPIPDSFRTDFPTTTGLARLGAKTRAAVICNGPIRWKQSAYLEEWKMLRRTIPESQWHECKITMPAPSYQHIQLKPGTAFTADSGYKTDEEYIKDLGKAYASEIKALYAEGVRNIQIDDPNLTYFCSSQFLNGAKQDGTDTDALLDTYLEAHNHFLRESPGSDLRMGMHLCRGNMSGSTHWVSGSYEQIAEKLFTLTDYETYFLEFDDAERQGGFEPLRFLPKGKNVVLGLVSTKKAELEDSKALQAKIEQAAAVIAKAQGGTMEQALGSLALSPQCGFSSSSLAGGKDMTLELMWSKLELVKVTAKEVWSDEVP